MSIFDHLELEILKQLDLAFKAGSNCLADLLEHYKPGQKLNKQAKKFNSKGKEKLFG